MYIKADRYEACTCQGVLDLTVTALMKGVRFIKMDIIRSHESVPYDKTVVALGNFDGLHSAHMAIINKCREFAVENGLKSGVLLFTGHTLNIIQKRSVSLITTEKQKLEILENAGMDFVYLREFNEEYMKLSPEEFVLKLKDVLHVRAVCVGYDYRFGYRAEGDAALLGELGRKYGFDVAVTDEIVCDGTAVKSTEIRRLIGEGRVERAAEFLGRPFAIEGEVVKGFQNGTKMGIPTANVDYADNVLLPKNGVYAGYTYIDGKKHKSVINVGNNPTFGADKITVESHIIGFGGDIYGKSISVEFIFGIRGEKKFSSVDELICRIKKDIEIAGKELE